MNELPLLARRGGCGETADDDQNQNKHELPGLKSIG
jgi:hypothetical protein